MIANIDIKNLKTAKRYATALIESSKNNIDEIEEDLKVINDVVFNDDALCSFFLHPVISLKDKKETLKEAFEGKINIIALNFIETLVDQNRLDIFKTIYEVFKKEALNFKNIQEIEVVSAVELNDSEKEALKQKLNAKLNKETIINYTKDEIILGGIIVKFEDKVIDLSLKTKFDALRKQAV